MNLKFRWLVRPVLDSRCGHDPVAVYVILIRHSDGGAAQRWGGSGVRRACRHLGNAGLGQHSVGSSTSTAGPEPEPRCDRHRRPVEQPAVVVCRYMPDC